jgi:hypothetical protein
MSQYRDGSHLIDSAESTQYRKVRFSDRLQPQSYFGKSCGYQVSDYQLPGTCAQVFTLYRHVSLNSM